MLVGSERRFVAATGIGLPTAETTPPGSAAGAGLEDLRGGVAQGGGRSRRPRHGDYRTALYINYVSKRIVRAITDRRVSFEWVKGHDGDLHTEAANRAARSVRRCNTYRIPASALSHVLDNIGQDIAACMLRDSGSRGAIFSVIRGCGVRCASRRWLGEVSLHEIRMVSDALVSGVRQGLAGRAASDLCGNGAGWGHSAAGLLARLTGHEYE